ncbi:unnamed protein product, partial [Staurois parvus]
MIPYCRGPHELSVRPLISANDTGQEGVNMRGNQRVNCVLCVCFPLYAHYFVWLCYAEPYKA